MKILAVIKKAIEMGLAGDSIHIEDRPSRLSYRKMFGAKEIGIGGDVDSPVSSGVYVFGKDNYNEIGEPDFIIHAGEYGLIGAYLEKDLTDLEKFARKHLGGKVKLTNAIFGVVEGVISGFNNIMGRLIISTNKGVWTTLWEDDVVFLPGNKYLYAELSEVELK